MFENLRYFANPNRIERQSLNNKTLKQNLLVLKGGKNRIIIDNIMFPQYYVYVTGLATEARGGGRARGVRLEPAAV